MNRVLVQLYSWGNYFFNIYHNLKSKVFFLSDIADNHDTDKRRLYMKFYLLYYLHAVTHYIPFLTNRVNVFSQSNNHIHNLIKIKITNGKIHRNIVYKDTTLHNLINNVKNINQQNGNHIFNENEIMMGRRFPVLDIYYKDASSNKVSIKDIINSYADKSKHYVNNSINNILKLEKINIHDNKIYILYLKIIKREEKVLDLNDLDYHVSDIYGAVI